MGGSVSISACVEWLWLASIYGKHTHTVGRSGNAARKISHKWGWNRPTTEYNPINGCNDEHKDRSRKAGVLTRGNGALAGGVIVAHHDDHIAIVAIKCSAVEHHARRSREIRWNTRVSGE